MILIVVWMAVIFAFSAQHAEQSSQISGGLVDKIVALFYPGFNSLSSHKQTELIGIITVIVRKTGHFSEYFILGVFSVLYVNTYQRYKFITRVVSATVFCILYAVSDEIHQYFVPGRACRFLDVCIDTAGSAIAIILLALILRHKIKDRSGDANA